jgi:HD-GYP domain-containing protein (c-di-GMP phosphodiesterase class II)
MGSVLLPTETKNPETAMQLADARMYINKASGRPSAGQQTRNLAMHLLATQEPDVFKHSERVAALAVAVGERLGMSVQALGELARAAELHDIGKVAIPFAVLQKPGPLTEQERELMRRHPIVGANLLSAAPALVGVAAIVRSSHERVDGTGYPDGLAGSEIPLASRIVFACSSFDAMTSDRAYRVGMSTEQAIEELARRAGTQFDPPVIAALEECLRAALPETESDTRTDETLTRKTPAITRPGMRTIPAH